MDPNAKELYAQAVRQWPVPERLRLAALILDEIAAATGGPTGRPRLSAEERKAALEELMRHAGAVSSGDPRSGNNEQIDADLAREYGKEL